MPRVTIFAMPLLACLALGLTTGAVRAQSTAFLYVGADSSQLNTGAGTGTVTAFGTTTSGLCAFINADSTTTDYKGLSAFGTGRITVTGGTFQQLVAGENSVINLIGYNFQQSDELQHDAFNMPYYEVTGTLQQETVPFTAEWYAPSTGRLLFDGLPAIPGGAPVPEASTTVSLGLLLLGTAGVIFKRRRAISRHS